MKLVKKWQQAFRPERAIHSTQGNALGRRNRTSNALKGLLKQATLSETQIEIGKF